VFKAESLHISVGASGAQQGLIIVDLHSERLDNSEVDKEDAGSMAFAN